MSDEKRTIKIREWEIRKANGVWWIRWINRSIEDRARDEPLLDSDPVIVKLREQVRSLIEDGRDEVDRKCFAAREDAREALAEVERQTELRKEDRQAANRSNTAWSRRCSDLRGELREARAETEKAKHLLHEIEAVADPAGELQEHARRKDDNEGLQVLLAEAREANAGLREESDGYFEALREKETDLAKVREQYLAAVGGRAEFRTAFADMRNRRRELEEEIRGHDCSGSDCDGCSLMADLIAVLEGRPIVDMTTGKPVTPESADEGGETGRVGTWCKDPKCKPALDGPHWHCLCVKWHAICPDTKRRCRLCGARRPGEQEAGDCTKIETFPATVQGVKVGGPIGGDPDEPRPDWKPAALAFPDGSTITFSKSEATGNDSPGSDWAPNGKCEKCGAALLKFPVVEFPPVTFGKPYESLTGPPPHGEVIRCPNCDPPAASPERERPDDG